MLIISSIYFFFDIYIFRLTIGYLIVLQYLTLIPDKVNSYFHNFPWISMCQYYLVYIGLFTGCAALISLYHNKTHLPPIDQEYGFMPQWILKQCKWYHFYSFGFYMQWFVELFLIWWSIIDSTDYPICDGELKYIIPKNQGALTFYLPHRLLYFMTTNNSNMRILNQRLGSGALKSSRFRAI